MNSKTNPIETARKKLLSVAKEITDKLGIEIHTVHFAIVKDSQDTPPRLSARLCYTDTSGDQVTTTRE